MVTSNVSVATPLLNCASWLVVSPCCPVSDACTFESVIVGAPAGSGAKLGATENDARTGPDLGAAGESPQVADKTNAANTTAALSGRRPFKNPRWRFSTTASPSDQIRRLRLTTAAKNHRASSTTLAFRGKPRNGGVFRFLTMTSTSDSLDVRLIMFSTSGRVRDFQECDRLANDSVHERTFRSPGKRE